MNKKFIKFNILEFYQQQIPFVKLPPPPKIRPNLKDEIT